MATIKISDIEALLNFDGILEAKLSDVPEETIREVARLYNREITVDNTVSNYPNYTTVVQKGCNCITLQSLPF